MVGHAVFVGVVLVVINIDDGEGPLAGVCVGHLETIFGAEEAAPGGLPVPFVSVFLGLEHGVDPTVFVERNDFFSVHGDPDELAAHAAGHGSEAPFFCAVAGAGIELPVFQRDLPLSVVGAGVVPHVDAGGEPSDAGERELVEIFSVGRFGFIIVHGDTAERGAFACWAGRLARPVGVGGVLRVGSVEGGAGGGAEEGGGSSGG